MAHTMGATMLPVHTRRVGPSRYEVTIGPPVEIPNGADGNPDYTAAVQNYADALAPFVLRDPGQWRGWRLINARVPWGASIRRPKNVALAATIPRTTRRTDTAGARAKNCQRYCGARASISST
jgi:hypothetical protein